MGSSESKPLPDTVRFLVVPIVVGVLTMIVMTYFEWMKDHYAKIKTKQIEQMENAITVGKKTIQILDELSSIIMKPPNSAWDVAWRRARYKEQKHHFPTPQDMLLEESDKQIWNMFLDKWKEWQCQEMSLETDLKASFGPTGPECILYKEIVERLEFASTMLWNIYYVKKTMQLQKERSFAVTGSTQQPHKYQRLPDTLFNKSKKSLNPSSLSYRLLLVEDDENNNNTTTASRSLSQTKPNVKQKETDNEQDGDDDDDEWTKEDQIQNGKEMYELFYDVRYKIQLLSESITILIQQHEVGTLRSNTDNMTTTEKMMMTGDYAQHKMMMNTNSNTTLTTASGTTTIAEEEEEEEGMDNGVDNDRRRRIEQFFIRRKNERTRFKNEAQNNVRRLLTFKETPFLVQRHKDKTKKEV